MLFLMRYPLFFQRWLFSGTLMLAAFPGCSEARPPSLPASGWTIEVLPSSWKMEDFEESMDLSGIATSNGRDVLVGSDELIAAQTGVVDRAARLIKGGQLLPLLQNASGKKMEIDIEGIAFSAGENCYFVTGSHGVGKKKGEYEPSRALVFRIPCDPATGLIRSEGIGQASLMPWLEQSAAFREYTKKPLQLNGFNIEGLTCKAGSLYFGVRGPNVQGNTFVIETTSASLFGGGLPACTLHSLPVGETRGIRELVAVRDGFLVLTGNASAEATKKFPTSQARMSDKVFDLFLWQPGREPAFSTIGVLPRPAGKAEALLVLEDSPGYVDLLVIFDGAPGGAPQPYRLTRP